jgi:hypothetical protein
VTAAVDWAGLERGLRDGVLRAARTWVGEHPAEPLGVVAFHHLYAETDGPIYLPVLALVGADTFAALPDDLQWSVADWADSDVDWVSTEQAAEWQSALTVYACSGSVEHWETTFDQFIDVLVEVCRQARSELSASGIDCLVVLLDDDDRFQESVLRRILTPGEVSRYFPWYDERAAELARVAALPEAEQAAYYVSRLDGSPTVVDSERAEAALRGLGRAAVDVLLPVLTVDGRAWRAAMLLADIGRPDDDVVAGLTDALDRRRGPDRDWAARALSRLGRLDIVLDRIDRLPSSVVVTALAAPYKAFRDRSVAPRRLDYAPLTEAIERWPDLEPALREELKPGTPFCHISREEVDEALAGLGSPHRVVRRHAVDVLGERGLGPDVGARVLPRLAQVIRTDPDPVVRRLAILSLAWWRHEARPYVDAIRQALDDPDPSVQDTAAQVLQDQRLS